MPEDRSPLQRSDSMDSLHSVRSRRGRSTSRPRLDRIATAGREKLQGAMDNMAEKLGYTRQNPDGSDNV
jgi:hypothetical protein